MPIVGIYCGHTRFCYLNSSWLIRMKPYWTSWYYLYIIPLGSISSFIENDGLARSWQLRKIKPTRKRKIRRSKITSPSRIYILIWTIKTESHSSFSRNTYGGIYKRSCKSLAAGIKSISTPLVVSAWTLPAYIITKSSAAIKRLILNPSKIPGPRHSARGYRYQ